jgi:hypothetical protein
MCRPKHSTKHCTSTARPPMLPCAHRMAEPIEWQHQMIADTFAPQSCTFMSQLSLLLLLLPPLLPLLLLLLPMLLSLMLKPKQRAQLGTHPSNSYHRESSSSYYNTTRDHSNMAQFQNFMEAVKV